MTVTAARTPHNHSAMTSTDASGNKGLARTASWIVRTNKPTCSSTACNTQNTRNESIRQFEETRQGATYEVGVVGIAQATAGQKHIPGAANRSCTLD